MILAIRLSVQVSLALGQIHVEHFSIRCFIVGVEEYETMHAIKRRILTRSDSEQELEIQSGNAKT